MGDLSVAELARAEEFLKVLKFRVDNPNMTIEEACKACGVAHSTFYSWVASDAEAMRMVKDTLSVAQKASLFEFSTKIYTALNLLLQDAVNSALKVDSRLRILKFVIPLFEDYAKIYHAVPGSEDQAAFLKEGPKLEHAQSRLATLGIDTTEDGKVKIDIYQDRPVLDAEFQESDEEEEESE